MKKTIRLKTLVLFGVMALGMLLPATMYAQGGNDNMFQVDDAFSGNRDITTTWVLINNGIGQSEAPLGSGLLILGAAGAGYVLAKRRHSRKGMTLVLALALMLGMTQCKKKDVETTTTGDLGKMVHITLNVDGGDRHIVYPGTGAVLYTDGDVIYVGDGSKYLGTLTYGSGAFSGDITEPAEGDYLYFYFLGGLTLASPSAGTTSYTVNISNQGSNLPVLSFGRSTSTYSAIISTYGCMLENKCALVEFVLTEGTTDAVVVSDMQTVAAIDFANPDNAIAANGTTDAITLNTQSETSKWAILLPSTSETSTVATIAGVDYNVTVPQITANGYLTGGAAVAIDNTVPAPSYVFSVSDTKTVRFSPGNLQYKEGEGWRFAPNQWDFCQSTDGPWDTSDWVDLFGWGTWGEGKNPLNTSTDAEDYPWSTDFQGTLNGRNDWYTLSITEWQYLFYSRTNASNLYGSAVVDYISGMIILPDNWTLPSGSSFNSGMKGWDNNTYDASQWATMESAGAVFLPAGGCRYGTNVSSIGVQGEYWSATSHNSGTINNLSFHAYYAYLQILPCVYAQHVRLVR